LTKKPKGYKVNIYQKPKYVVEFKSATANKLLAEISELLSRADVSPEAYPTLLNLDALVRKETNIIARAKANDT